MKHNALIPSRQLLHSKAFIDVFFIQAMYQKILTFVLCHCIYWLTPGTPFFAPFTFNPDDLCHQSDLAYRSSLLYKSCHQRLQQAIEKMTAHSCFHGADICLHVCIQIFSLYIIYQEVHIDFSFMAFHIILIKHHRNRFFRFFVLCHSPLH